MRLHIGKVPLSRILRRSWIVVLCMVVAASTAGVLAAGPASYTADAVMIVPGGGSGEPGRASEAQRLAATYAAVLGEDDGVTPIVASAVGRSRWEVEQRLEVVNVMGTSVVQMSYEGQTPQEAVAAVSTVVRLVTGDEPQTPTVSPGTLLPTRVVGQAEPTPRTPAVPIGVILGLALGVLLVVMLERAEPHIDDAGDLQALVAAPVNFVRPTPESVGALAARWSRHTDAQDTVAIVPLLPGDAPAAAAVYDALRQHVEAHGLAQGTPVSLPPFAGTAQVVLEHGSLSGEIQGHVLSEGATAVVLVLTQGSHTRYVKQATRALYTMDARVLWCLVVPRPRPRRIRVNGRQGAPERRRVRIAEAGSVVAASPASKGKSA